MHTICTFTDQRNFFKFCEYCCVTGIVSIVNVSMYMEVSVGITVNILFPVQKFSFRYVDVLFPFLKCIICRYSRI